MDTNSNSPKPGGVSNIDPEHMKHAIEAFPQSKLNRSMSAASLLAIPRREERSESSLSASLVSHLRELRNRFNQRTEQMRELAMRKSGPSSSEGEEDGEDKDEQLTGDATATSKSEEKELQLDGGMEKTTSDRSSWWPHHPGRRLVVRQPFCTACLAPHRRHFVVIRTKPCVRIEHTEVETKPAEQLSGMSEEEGCTDTEPEIIGQEWIEPKEWTCSIPPWIPDFKALFTTCISPHSIPYLIWLTLLSLAVIYNYVTIPLREAFDIYDTEEWASFWLPGNVLADIIYLTDIALIRPRLEFLKRGIVMTDYKSCALNYVKSWQFKLDILSIVPLDLVSLAYNRELARFRVLRLFKIQAFWDAFERLDQRLNAGFAVRLIRTLIYMIYIIHIEACGYYGFNRWQGMNATSWSIPIGSVSPYLYSYFICMKIASSIGSLPSATNPMEFIFMTCYWLSGIFVSAILIGQVIDILDSANANKVNYRRTMDATLACMHHLHAPEQVINKVRTWFMYNWDQQKTFDENSLFESLPVKLKSDLAINVHYHTLSKVTLFQNCERALIYDMVLKLKPVVFLPMDYICRKGEVGKEMYIVKSGIVEVVGGPNNSVVFVTLKEGSVFGEISLLALSGKNRRTADVRSKGFSTLFSLSKQDFEEIMKNYPRAHQLLKKRSQRMLNRDKKKAKEEEKAKQQVEEEIKVAETAVEVIGERPATPKLVDAVVMAVTANLPEGSVPGSIRRLSTQVDTDSRRLSRQRSRACSRSTGPTTPMSVEEELTDGEQKAEPPKAAEAIKNDAEEEESTTSTEVAPNSWLDRLRIGRSPCGRLRNFFPSNC